MLESGGQRVEVEHAQAARGELQRQRQPVEARDDLADRMRTFWSVMPKPGRTAPARSTKSRTDSQLVRLLRVRTPLVSGSASGDTRNSCSPDSRSGIRLVASTVTFGASSRSAPSDGLASMSCSRLSSTSSSSRSRRCSSMVAGEVASRRLRTRSAPAISAITNAGIGDGAEVDEDDAVGGTDRAGPKRPSTPAASCPCRRDR